jgi:hypothetical protein
MVCQLFDKIHVRLSKICQLVSVVDELRHLEGIKGNFMLSETQYVSPVMLFWKYVILQRKVDQHYLTSK